MGDATSMFIVSHGEYSAYVVDGVCADEATAEAIADKAQRLGSGGYYSTYSVEEVPVLTDVFVEFFHQIVAGTERWRSGRGELERTERTGDSVVFSPVKAHVEGFSDQWPSVNTTTHEAVVDQRIIVAARAASADDAAHLAGDAFAFLLNEFNEGRLHAADGTMTEMG